VARLRLALLGAFQASLDGRPLTHFASDKVRALLAYLAVEANRPHSREALATLLWPDWPQQKALYYLRNALSGLRKLLEEPQAKTPFLWVTHDTLQFNSSWDYWLDVTEFQRLVALPRPQAVDVSAETEWMAGCAQAVDLYTGDFLESLSIDSLPFEEWVMLKREGLHQSVLEALHRLGEYHLATGDYEKALQYARRQVGLEPWREEAYQQGMRALSLAGQRSEALAQYETCCRQLADELGVAPGTETIRLYESIRDGKLSPAASQKNKLHNLPAAVTSFIGREHEIAAILRLLQGEPGGRGCRLVTLTGAGGVGKTRLAIQTAAQLVNQFADGVWLVELAPVVDPDLVPAMTARSLGLREQMGSQVVSFLQDYLEPRHLLLLLDNCEHLVEACARLADTLLNACPSLSLLVTSREALGISGETVFYVPSLSLPDIVSADHEVLSTSFEALGKYESVRLFLDRAGAAAASFTFTPVSAPAIAQICVRLDGIPLAIELAAACTRVLQVEEIVQRLEDRFQLLTGGSRTALPRYQTLRASIDWSYGLLSPTERMLLQRLSVFAGGWGLVAAEAVCALPAIDQSSAASAAESVGRGEEIEACQVLQRLGQLVNKSLVTVEEKPGRPTRYHMLEIIRQYALEKLAESGQADAAHHRHLHYYLELAEKVDEKIRGPDIARILDQLETELDNLRLALAWSLEGKGRPGWNPEPGLRLAAALKWFWHCRGRYDEGIHWLELLLAGELDERGDRPLTPERIQCRAKALYVTAWLALMIDEITKASKLSAESCELYQSLGADGRVGYAYALLFFSVDQRAKPSESNRLMDECQTIFQKAGDRFGLGECYMVRGHIAVNNNDFENAKTYYEGSLALRKEIGDLDGIAGAYMYLGHLAYRQGNTDQARALVEQSLGLFSKIHNDSFLGFQYIHLGMFDMMDGNYAQAASHASEALSIGRRQGDVSLIELGLLTLGELGLLQGHNLEAMERLEESLAFFRKKDHKVLIADTLYYLGLLAWTMGELEQAWQMYMEALANYRLDGTIYHEARVLCELGKVALARGETNQAQALFEQVFKINILIHYFFWEYREPAMLILEATAALAAVQGKMEGTARNSSIVARLLGATEAWHIRYYHCRTPRECQEREACIATVRAAMGEQAFTAAFAEGQAMTKEQAVEYAKGVTPSPQPSPK
jgi:predicted ATPase/DNA-binding SARP family transcriptional activator/Tfp pilus assembly protein PilF